MLFFLNKTLFDWLPAEQTNHRLQLWVPLRCHESSFKCDPQQQPAVLLLSSCARRELELARADGRVCVCVCQSARSSQPAGVIGDLPTRTAKVTPQWGGWGVGRLAEHLKGTLLSCGGFRRRLRVAVSDLAVTLASQSPRWSAELLCPANSGGLAVRLQAFQTSTGV